VNIEEVMQTLAAGTETGRKVAALADKIGELLPRIPTRQELRDDHRLPGD
jgi:hypothetical protein